MKTIKQYKQDIELLKLNTSWSNERRDAAINLAELLIKKVRAKNKGYKNVK